MGRAAVKTSLAVSRLLRDRSKELRLSTNEVSRRLAARGERIPQSTLVRIEQGKLDPGVRRLHRLLALYRIPPQLVADLIDLESRAVEHPASRDLDTLYQEGVEAWKQGDIPKGLAYLFAVRQYVPETDEAGLLRQKATLAFAVFARNLGKYRLAHQLVDDLLFEPPDPSLLPNVLILAADIFQGLGSIEAALAMVERACTYARPGKPQLAAWVLHQKARLLMLMGRAGEAGEVLWEAVESYRAAGDRYGEGKALLLRVRIAEAQRDLEGALDRVGEVLRFSDGHGDAELGRMARLARGHLLLERGDLQAGLDEMNNALADAVRGSDRHAEFLAHYHLWKAYARAGDGERAQLELGSAEYFVRFVDAASAEADEVRGLQEKGVSHARPARAVLVRSG